MKKLSVISILMLLLISFNGFSQDAKLTSKKSQIKFFSTTPAEDIQATNTAAVSTITPSSGEVIFSVPMQSFEFEKALMQKHYNSPDFLDTKQFPKSKLKGTITNLSEINFSKDGTYNAVVKGEMTLHGVTKPVQEKGTITIKGKTITVHSVFKITLADYGIAFEKGKPSSNIAKTVEVTIDAEY